jgi:Bor protein
MYVPPEFGDARAARHADASALPWTREIVMTIRRWLALALSIGLSTGCYHQVVDTGRAPGKLAVEHWFVSTWLWGLVPAKEIDVRRECPAGIATIMTETSFVDGLVSVLTIGIYTPQHVRITCALQTASLPPGAMDVTIPATSSASESAAVLRRAVESVEQSGTPVVLHF